MHLGTVDGFSNRSESLASSTERSKASLLHHSPHSSAIHQSCVECCADGRKTRPESRAIGIRRRASILGSTHPNN